MQPELERRRGPRIELEAPQELSLEVSIAVQVLDISLSGVLLSSKTEVAVGDRAELKATLGERSVKLAIEIRRVIMETPTRSGHRYRAGAVFAQMSAEQRLVLEQLLGTEPL
jgi:hypothetical protein